MFYSKIHYVFIVIVIICIGGIVFLFNPSEQTKTNEQTFLKTEQDSPKISKNLSMEENYEEILNTKTELSKLYDNKNKNKKKIEHFKKTIKEKEKELTINNRINIYNNSDWYDIFKIAQNYINKKRKSEQIQKEIKNYKNLIEEYEHENGNIRTKIKNKETELSNLLNTSKISAIENKIEIEPDATEFINKMNIDFSVENWENVFIMPVVGEITSPFGWRRHPIYGDNRFHSGADIGADYGDYIRASNYGMVVYSDWYDGFGNTIIISHGNGIFTLYGHNSSLVAEYGQIVQRGDVIALAGSTGNSTGPHCHFSMWINQELVDPMDYVLTY